MAYSSSAPSMPSMRAGRSGAARMIASRRPGKCHDSGGAAGREHLGDDSTATRGSRCYYGYGTQLFRNNCSGLLGPRVLPALCPQPPP